MDAMETDTMQAQTDTMMETTLDERLDNIEPEENLVAPAILRKRSSAELDLSTVRSARARFETKENSDEPKEKSTGLAGASRFRAMAKVVTSTTAAARVHRTHRLSAGDAATHSYAENECLALSDFINHRLGADESLSNSLPIEESSQLFSAVHDGVLLCKLINLAAADEVIDPRAINVGATTPFHITENLNLALSAAKGIGLTIVNIGAQDMIEGRPHLVLGLVWQVVKMALLSKISLKANPNLIRLLQEGEELEALLKLSPEELLVRWFNYHLEKAGAGRRLKNFGADLRDSELYVTLLKQIDPEGKCTTGVLQNPDATARAAYVVEQGERLGAEFKLRPADIVKGNEKLNMGFVAALFNACPALEPPDEDLFKLFAELPDDDVGDSREERAFRMWINSLNLGCALSNLFEDVRDGLLLLRTMDAVRHGVVEWRRVNMTPKLVFKRVENLNYAVDLALSPFKFSLVGVQGKDIADGNRKLTLALVWQLMRTHLVEFLAALKSKSGDGAKLTDADMVGWANRRVASGGSSALEMRDFNDKSLSSGLFFLELLAAIEPRCVNRAMVTAGQTDDERSLNAKYAIACARKLGCALFCLPEDLVEVRPKMVLSFIASVMAVGLER